MTTRTPLPPTWEDAFTGYARHLRSGKILETTVALRRRHLHQLANVHPDPWAVTADDLEAWMANPELARTTASSVRSTLRTFYAWAAHAGLIAESPAADLRKIPTRAPSPHPLGDDALRAALATATEREVLMIHLAGRCGMRRGEVARCRGQDVHGRDGEWSISIMGKGERPRVVPIADDLAHAIRSRGDGWTFPNGKGGHLSADYVGAEISRLLPPGWSMHSLRHRFATRAYGATRDVYSVQSLLGHASPATTLIYVKVPDDAMRRAMLAAS